MGLVQNLLQAGTSDPEILKLRANSAFQNTGNAFLQTLRKVFPATEPPIKTNEESTAIPYYGTVIGDLLYNPSTVSISTFQRMIYTDSLIGLCIEYLSANIESRIGEYCHENKEIEKAVRKMFKCKLKGRKKRLVKFINSRNWAGFFMGQMIWRFDKEDQMDYCVQVRPLPPSTVQLRIDHAGEILQGRENQGVLQFQFNFVPGLTNGFNSLSGGFSNAMNYANSSGAVMPYLNGESGQSFNDPLASTGDADFPIRSYFIPPYVPVGMHYETFLHSVYDIGDGFLNPYGRPPTRRIHSLYVLKYAVIQLSLVALDRRGQPMVFNYCDTQKTIVDPATNIQYSPVDIANGISPFIHSTSMVNLPGRKGEIYEVEAIKSDADLGIFVDMLDQINEQIKDSLFVPSGLLGGKGGSYASAAQHGGMFDRLIMSLCEEVSDDILTQLIAKFLEYNFDPEDYEDCKEALGYFEYNSLSLDEQLKNAKLAEILKNINAVSDQDLEDLNKIRSSAGYLKVEKAFEPLVEAPKKTSSTNTRNADRGPYAHEPIEDH